jgi:hypothetical protein
MYSMKKKNLMLSYFLMLCFLIVGCSKDADDAANSNSGFRDEDINGIWKESSSGFAIRITGATTSTYGSGYVNQTGSAFPAGAIGGRCMSEIELVRGGYFEGQNWTYTGSSWVKGSIVGMAMVDSKTSFKIGSKTYIKQ